MLAASQKNGLMDFHEIFRKGRIWHMGQSGSYWGCYIYSLGYTVGLIFSQCLINVMEKSGEWIFRKFMDTSSNWINHLTPDYNGSRSQTRCDGGLRSRSTSFCYVILAMLLFMPIKLLWAEPTWKNIASNLIDGICRYCAVCSTWLECHNQMS